MMLNGRKRSSAFTARQWEELEHQALIFKYMTYGIPIPPDLLYPVRRGWDSFPINPTIPRLFPQHPSGWGYFPLGFGRKAEDPEPGRCRRTDGKKWRCSKEAFPDSKYCERHMHRGRNRSRKPVELTSSAPISSTPSSTTFSSSSSLSQNLHHPFLYPHSSSSLPPPFSFSNQNTTAQFNPETTSSYTSTEKDYRHLHPFFSEATGSLRSITPNSNLDNSLQFTPLRSSCLDELKQRNCSVFPSSFSPQQQQPKQQHCFVLGADFKLDARKVKVEQEDEPKQPLRWFFDEWPAQQKNRDSWLDLKAERSDHAMNSTTQLSISIPAPDSLFSASNSRSLNDH